MSAFITTFKSNIEKRTSHTRVVFITLVQTQIIFEINEIVIKIVDICSQLHVTEFSFLLPQHIYKCI